MTSLSTSALVPASVLSEFEMRRRESNRRPGLCHSGCAEIDDYVLLGGLERGSVVGVSCEDERFGVIFAMQIVARGLVAVANGITSAHVITPRPRNEILTALRDSIVAQLVSRGGIQENGGSGSGSSNKNSGSDLRAQTRGLLEHVMLSCVFDMEGVQEVIAGMEAEQPRRDAPAAAAAHIPEREIRDSQEEDDEEEEGKDNTDEVKDSEDRARTPSPEVIIITHFGALMTGLFAHRSSSSAHEAVAQLSLQLRRLSRSTSTPGPLIILLNSTASSTIGSSEPNAIAERSGGNSHNVKPLNPTLRSIFNPPLLPDFVHQQHQHHGPHAGAATTTAAAVALAHRNKPTFGLFFSNFLDVHILCTRVPRTDADAEVALGFDYTAAVGDVSYATVVEVLQDEMGAWPATAETAAAAVDGEEDEGRDGDMQQRASKQRRRTGRRYREQRWGAVAIRDGRIVDAF